MLLCEWYTWYTQQAFRRGSRRSPGLAWPCCASDNVLLTERAAAKALCGKTASRWALEVIFDAKQKRIMTTLPELSVQKNRVASRR